MKQQGFTLVELLVTVLIIGILVAVALPNYQRSVIKSRRTDATFSINTVQLAQEKYRMNNPSYASPVDLGLTVGTATTMLSKNGHYNISVSNITATSYTITATPVASGPQANDTECPTIVLQHSGNTTTQTPVNCWGA